MLFVLVGVAARVRQWLGGRSLWLDEVLIADNLVHRGFGLLATQPLLHHQVAPLLWVELEHLAVVLLGPSERALRLLPLACGIGVVLLGWAAARRLLPAVLVPVAVLLLALHPALIYYANETKQYSTDALCVLVIVLLALDVSGRGETSALRRLTATGVVLVWLSHVAVFALGGVSVVLLLRAGTLRRAGHLALILSPWPVSFALSALVSLHSIQNEPDVSNYWRDTYPDSLSHLPDWLLARSDAVAANPLHLTLPVLGLAVLAIGVVQLIRLRRRDAVLALSAVPLALVAAAAQVYPFADRLVLWVVPLAALTLAAAPGYRRSVPWLAATCLALALVTGPALSIGVRDLVHRQTVEELGPLLTQLAVTRQPGDLVLVEVGSLPAFDYYARGSGVSRDGVILFVSQSGALPCEDHRVLDGAHVLTDRVWVVSSHHLADGARLGTTGDLLTRVRAVSRQVQHLHQPSADAYLFDPSSGPTIGSASIPANPHRCLAVIRDAR
ncbi:MAG: hypothetical protein NVS3B26_30400 [Mycobacteriales bacterium]